MITRGRTLVAGTAGGSGAEMVMAWELEDGFMHPWRNTHLAAAELAGVDPIGEACEVYCSNLVRLNDVICLIGEAIKLDYYDLMSKNV